MIEDIPDHRRVLDETDDPHGPLTFRAGEGIYFVYLLNQPGPTFPVCRRGPVGFDDVRDGVVSGSRG